MGLFDLLFDTTDTVVRHIVTPTCWVEHDWRWLSARTQECRHCGKTRVIK